MFFNHLPRVCAETINFDCESIIFVDAQHPYNLVVVNPRVESELERNVAKFKVGAHWKGSKFPNRGVPYVYRALGVQFVIRNAN